ncbi:ABC transporter ATP-binding protein [Vibrio cholerae]|nr:ABC transporter ATP-binding protein [Vibrio cholerae]
MLAKQAAAKSELEQVELEWMAEQETLEEMERKFNG